ncbi:MAG: TrmH family RNA methyltransferase [Candidatus Pacebacteria bacterium]|jgi:tRNA G18 (ribose-2'-O)-methylase SpoU|nr:TrmH family RNA methyltransferase [Candidatus Paceibacterota bacterium]
MNNKIKVKITLILDNIRSSENVGSIFRTADAGGVERIYLIGITPNPVDRFGRLNPKINKASLGAEKNILWEHFENIGDVIEKLKKDDYKIVSLEQNENSIDYRDLKIKEKIALIAGNEVSGISAETQKQSDEIIEIPMAGDKESLNVSVATGIALFSILKK